MRSVEVGEHSRGRKEAPLRSSASRRLTVDESSKGRKGMGGQAPLRSSTPRCLELPPSRESYKDVLMKRLEPHYPTPNPQRSNLYTSYPSYPSRGTPRRSLAKRCDRCLASDHIASACRDPVRCWRCWKTGHRAYSCRGKSTTSDATMDRAVNRRGRAPLPKVFVPYTEEYLRRVELRRNAVLVDVIQPANLGHDPITVIKTTLASRFEGYVDDFVVARYRERDFAIFLLEWVPTDLLIRREIITLNGFWIRCWPWGQYRYARPHRVLFKAWIRLLNLLFEIWSVARVVALVSSFGRFIRADSATKAMTDLRAFRCQIALDSINNIPRTCRLLAVRNCSRDGPPRMVKHFLLHQDLPREEGNSSLEVGGLRPLRWLRMEGVLGRQLLWVLGRSQSVFCSCFGPGPYSVPRMDPSLDCQLWATPSWSSWFRTSPIPVPSRSTSLAHYHSCNLGLGLLADPRPSPLPAVDSGLGLLFDPRPSPLLRLSNSGLGPPSGLHQTLLYLSAQGLGLLVALSLLSDSRPLDSGLAQLAPELAGVCEGISDPGLAQHPPRPADLGRGHPRHGQLLLLDRPLHHLERKPRILDRTLVCVLLATSSTRARARALLTPQPEFTSAQSTLNRRNLSLRRRMLRLPPRAPRLH
uniref:CCHC-type domain-containing protein n=1 Tax=Ananas comosus var. bracteatus TaxID=296719 RepID=A0A6V7P233_ANACO|nr:unnamed protein product [Ananas comosus var. bracteatus]